MVVVSVPGNEVVFLNRCFSWFSVFPLSLSPSLAVLDVSFLDSPSVGPFFFL